MIWFAPFQGLADDDVAPRGSAAPAPASLYAAGSAAYELSEDEPRGSRAVSVGTAA